MNAATVGHGHGAMRRALDAVRVKAVEALARLSRAALPFDPAVDRHSPEESMAELRHRIQARYY